MVSGVPAAAFGGGGVAGGGVGVSGGGAGRGGAVDVADGEEGVRGVVAGGGGCGVVAHEHVWGHGGLCGFVAVVGARLACARVGVGG